MTWLLTAIACALALLGGIYAYGVYVGNPRVERELLERPGSERAQKVMLIRLPSGRRIPVNYLRKGGFVFAGADGRWWKELTRDGARVTVTIRGEELPGRARAIENDPGYTESIFKQLRPDSYKWLFWGVLVEIELD